ncbi:MAG TPA: hypothetical protein DCY17_00550 [Clostridiales bacterium]|nr:hypothetical protein [Clostridiales bacterium]
MLHNCIFMITFGRFKGNFETLSSPLYIIQPLFRSKNLPENARIYKLVQKCFDIFLEVRFSFIIIVGCHHADILTQSTN